MTDAEKYMWRCLELAQMAKDNGKTAVGSLLVRDGQIIAEGIEGEDRLPLVMSHAENIAVLKAIEKLQTRDLSDCVLYTTVEPCFMCAYLIRQMKIGKVIYGTETPAGGHSSPFPILTTDQIPSWLYQPEVIAGVLRKECEEMVGK